MITNDIQESPIFITGAPRSGTTWLQRLLLSLPQFCGSQESHFFVVFGPVLRSFDVTGRPRAPGLSNYWKEAEMAAEIRSLWDRTVNPVIQANPQAQWFVEKTPGHIHFVREIVRILPKARFIQMVRDSRAVVASLLHASAGWGSHWAPRNISDAINSWRRCVESGFKARDVLSEDTFCQVHYERLLANPLGELESVLRFIGTEATRPVLEKVVFENSFEIQKEVGGTSFAQYGDRATATSSLKEPDGFFRKGKADSWKTDLSFIQRAWVWKRTKDLMLRLGYDGAGSRDVPLPVEGCERRMS